MALTQSILFLLGKNCLGWQQRQGAGAGLHNLGNTCFLNSVLQCLTYTPPLANYLLSGEHSRSCRQQGFCMMCIMEAHVTQVLHSSGSAIEPWAVVSVLPLIGEHFQLGMQEDAHEFLCYTVHAMQTACLSGSSHLDISSQATTIIRQVFGGFLRSRVTCLSCKAVSDSYEDFLDVPLDIKEAPSVTAALEEFVKAERLDGENCLKCSRCDKMVAASKRFTVHGPPKVLTVCLKRFEDFTGKKITKLVEYPEYLDLQPYTSQAAGGPLLYALYAVLVHRGDNCREGHYFCYTKASNGLWYEMDDEFVHGCNIDTVLQQEAYLLFYVRFSDLKTGEQPASSTAPSDACSFPSQQGAGSKEAQPVGPQGLPRHTKDMAVGMEDSPEDSGSSTTASTSQLTQAGAPEASAGWPCTITSYVGFCLHRFFCSCRRLLSRRKAACRVCCQPADPVLLHTVGEDSNKKEENGFPPSHCQRKSTGERARSRSPQWGKDARSWSVDTTDYDHSTGRRRKKTSPPSRDHGPRDVAAAGPSNGSSQSAPTPSAAQEQTLPMQRERSRSPRRGYDLCRWFSENTDYHHLGRRRSGSRARSPHHDQAPRDDAAPWPQNTSSKWAPTRRAAQKQMQLRQRERSRSPRRGYDLRSRHVHTNRQRSHSQN